MRTEVALFTRAWIEIAGVLLLGTFALVALFTRAWIEIDYNAVNKKEFSRRPLHEGVD